MARESLPLIFNIRRFVSIMMKIILFFSGVFYALSGTGMKLNRFHYEVQYRDTTGTFIQIFMHDSSSGELLNTKFEMEYGSASKKISTYVVEAQLTNQPKIIKIKPGIYSFKLKSRQMDGIEIKKDNLNCIHFYLPLSTLQFSFIGEKSIPSKLQATVIENIAPHDTILQNWNEIKSYKSSKYSVEINTLPILKFSIELGNGALYELKIPKPIALSILNTDKHSNINIYYATENSWVHCKNIFADYPPATPLYIQPGMYRISWESGGGESEKIIHLADDQPAYHFEFTK